MYLRDPVAFDCQGCGWRVHRYAEPPDNRLCFTCNFIETTIVDPLERAAMRAHLCRERAEAD